jgi:hypothetical protein
MLLRLLDEEVVEQNVGTGIRVPTVYEQTEASRAEVRILRACANRLWFAGGSVLPAVANPALSDEPPDHYDHVGEPDPEVYDPILPLGTPEQFLVG